MIRRRGIGSAGMTGGAKFKRCRRHAALAVVLMAYPCGVAASQCRVSAPPTIGMNIRVTEVQESIDTSRDELDQLAIAIGELESLPVYGAYTAALGYHADIDSHIERLGDNALCALPDSVQVHVELTNRVIHLAREAKTSSCLLETTRAHILRHAHADEQALDEGKAPFLDQLRTMLAHLEIEEAASPLAAKQRLADATSKQIVIELDELETYRHQLSQSINTAFNLARLHGACQP